MGGILLLVFVVVVAGLVKLPGIRGAFGEFMVNLTARLSLDPDQYAMIPNVTLLTTNGTTQIDHVIISEYGIFVIETKNMRGWIYGSENDEKWTQVIYRSKRRFQNPLRQNYAHVCALAEVFGIPKDKMFPIVVFAGDVTFKTAVPAGVFYRDDYIRYIKSKTKKLLTRAEVLDIITRVFDRRLAPGWSTRRRHIENLERLHHTRLS